MSNSFSEIYRPKKPSQLIGEVQRNVAKSLLDSVDNGKIIQEVLFSGDSGIGKTTIAKIYIEKILGYPYDGQPFNCADKTGVQYIRDEVIGTLNYLPLDGSRRVYFLDEIHMLSPEAQNSLLVAIEPVPPHVILIACTTQPNKLISTLRSRFTEFQLTTPSLVEFQKLAKWLCTKEGKQIDDKIRDQVISVSGGNVRKFDRYFQQALQGAFNPEDLSEEKQSEIELVKLLLGGNKNLSDWFKRVDDSVDYVRQATGMVGYSIAVLKNKNSPQAKAIVKYFGDNPTRSISDKYTFFNRLLAVYEELYGTHS